jgi:hypothetical protein
MINIINQSKYIKISINIYVMKHSERTRMLSSDAFYLTVLLNFKRLLPKILCCIFLYKPVNKYL